MGWSLIRVSIRISPDFVPATLQFIEKTVKEILPGSSLEYDFFEDKLDREYHSEKRMQSIMNSIAFLAIFISCLGVLGLASFTAELRTKEIGIRKVLGASVPGILSLLSIGFIKWIMLANIISWPIAYLAMNKWLQNFAYRINMNVWMFILSGLSTLVIALLTVSYQTLKAATANPLNSLRYE